MQSAHKAALVGCGDVSVVHFEALENVDGVELVAVCDTDPGTASRSSQQQGVPGYTNLAEMLEKERPDVVHVATPHDQHVPVILEALDAGVHVLTEKPLANTLAEADRVIDAASKTDLKVGVCFQNRYNLSSQRAHELLASGELGNVQGGAGTVIWTRTADYYHAKPWRGVWDSSGGGLLINQAIHTLDLLQWLVGPVTDVDGTAYSRIFRDIIEVEDTAEMVLHHTGGIRSVFYATLAHAVADPVLLELVTEEAVIRIWGDMFVTYKDGRQEVVSERKAPTTGRSYWGLSHEYLIRDFYAKLSDPEPFWISPAEGRKTLEIIDKVYEQSGIRP